MAILADNALTTLETVKERLGITDALKDNIIIAKINQYSQSAENIARRIFGKNDYDEFYPGSDTQNIIVDNYPILSIAEIKVRDSIIDNTECRIKGFKGVYSEIKGGFPEIIQRGCILILFTHLMMYRFSM